MKTAKQIVLLLLCWLSIGFIAYTIAEKYVFWHISKLMPSFAQAGLGDGHILLQYSKKNLVPENYIAILGDSYASGVGEWQERVSNQIRPDYHAGHLLHKLTSRDVVTFGMPGAGSIRSIVTLPKTFISTVRNTYKLNIDDPATMLVYFYEGNDLDDNLEDISARFAHRGYDQNKLYDSDYFQQFLLKEGIVNDDEYQQSLPKNYLDRFFLAKFFYVCVTGFIANKFSFSHHSSLNPYPDGVVNKVRLDSGVVSLGDSQDRMGLSLSMDETKLGIYVFEQSIKFLKNQYPDSNITIIYIPSGLSSYQLASDKVSTRYHRIDTLYPSSMVPVRSNQICQMVHDVAQQYNLEFFDTRPGIRLATQKTLVHDPINWTHFNQAGYTVLAHELLLSLEQSHISKLNNPCAIL